MPMHDITAIILAAGLSQRMGVRNKLLLPINGTPMIRHMVNIYAAVTKRPVLVVTGHQAWEVELALSGAPARAIMNIHFAQGQPMSVARGLQEADADAPMLVGLGDQPLLTPDDLRALIAAHAAADPARISIPMQGTQRGNPILIPANLRTRLLADPRAPGCKTFTRAHPDHVQFHQMTAPGFFADIDTPADYDALTSVQAAE